MNCPFCSKEIGDNAKFCSKCGKTIPRCPKCNTVIQRRIKFCPKCASPIPEELVSGFTNSGVEKSSVVKSKFCKKCGKKIFGENTICEECLGKMKNYPPIPRGGNAGPVPERGKQQKRKSPVILIIILAILLLGICGVGALFGIRYLKEKDNTATTELSTESVENTEAVENTQSTDNTEAVEAETTEDSASPQVEENSSPTEPSANSQAYTTASAYSAQAESVVGEFENHAYLIFNYRSLGIAETYESCERYCEQMGGHLAVIESQEENDYIYSLVTNTTVNGEHLKIAFFGYSDAESEGNWKWVNGSTSTYTNWCQVKGKQQPNNGSSSKSKDPENYAEFYKETANGTWNDCKFGANTFRFVCEWE